MPRSRQAGRQRVLDRCKEDPAFGALVLLACITVGGLVLRLFAFDDSLLGDEISTHFIVVGNGVRRVLELVHSDQEVTPPLFFLVTLLTRGLLGDPGQSIRLLPLIAGVASIPLTYLLGLWTVGRRAALVGATCMALSPFMILYSAEGRAYMPVLFLVLLSTLSLVRAVDTRRNVWWVAYAFFSCAAFYTHYTVLFPLFVQFAWAFWTQPKARRALVVSNVAAAVAYLPWLGGFREDLGGPSFLPEFSVDWALDTVGQLWIGHPYLPTSFMPGTKFLIVGAVGVLVGAFGGIVRARASGPGWWRIPPRAVLIVALAFGPPALLTLQSLAGERVLAPRNLIASVPAFALFVGAVVTSPRTRLRVVAVVMTLAAFAVGAVKMTRDGAQRPAVDDALAYVVERARPGDPIVNVAFFSNPLTELDVELRDEGLVDRYDVIRLTSPPLSQQLAALDPPNPVPGLYLPITPPEEVADEAVAAAKRGTVFVLSSTTMSKILREQPDNVLSKFIRALPARFRMVEKVSFSGLDPSFRASVFVFQDPDVAPKGDRDR